MNTQGTSGGSVTVALPKFELVSWRGEIFGPYPTMEAAAQAAKDKWPDQEQDENETGSGWSIQQAGGHGL